MRRSITAFAATAITFATLLGTAATATADITPTARIGWVTAKECVAGGGKIELPSSPFSWYRCAGGRYDGEYIKGAPGPWDRRDR
ncbi:hypothetical protein [Amycolatopsis sp. NPDC051071]|uniref:hypothetical protein n=1 Tax=Amycolatopsis sp. NPDC051071 TaxID=3154637 RepID=UPI00343EC014